MNQGHVSPDRLSRTAPRHFMTPLTADQVLPSNPPDGWTKLGTNTNSLAR